jgi:DNA transformation protein and related proteins
MSDTVLADHLTDLYRAWGGVTFKRMFGGHGAYRDGVMFGLIAYGVFYLKVDVETKPLFEAENLAPFVYDGGAKPITMSYHRAPERALDDPDELVVWSERALAAAKRMAASKGKKKR